jgi:hypothetical protein
MSDYTPTLLLATVGIIKGQGIGVSPDLTSAANDFNTTGISGSVQGLYTRTTPENKNILETLPGFMTGLPPEGINYPSGFSNSNLIGEVTASANNIAGGGPSKFANYMGQSSGFAATTFGLHGALAQAQGMKFDDLGFTFKNYKDVISGGVTSQFSSTETLYLATELRDLGTMYSISDLANLGDPGTLCMNLINQGYGDVGSLSPKLEEQGFVLTDLSGANPTVITEILATIDGSNFDDIVTLTNYRPYDLAGMSNLSDVLNIDLVFSPRISSTMPSLASLGNKLGNVGGRFSNFTELADFYASIETGSYDSLDNLKSMSPADGTLDIGGAMGTGSGPFGNPTTVDIIGSAAGVGYTNEIADMVQAQATLINDDADVRALHDYLANNPNPDSATLKTLSDNVITKPGLQDIISDNNGKLIDIGNRISTEKTNQQIVGMQFGNAAPTGNMQGVASMGTQIPGFAVDPMRLGLGSQISNMAQPGLYGDSLKASLQESRNLSRMQAFGIDPGTKMDPMAYAKQLGSMQG